MKRKVLLSLGFLFAWAFVLAALMALARAAHADPIEVVQVGRDGACHLAGTLPAGATRTLACAVGHGEESPLLAQIETGSLQVHGQVLRTSGYSALVAVTNFGTAAVTLDFAVVRLFRAPPAAPTTPMLPRELCIVQAIAAGQDPHQCDNVKSATPAAATAGVE